MSVSVAVNDDGLKRLIAKVKSNFDPQTMLRAIGLRSVKWITDNFEQQGGLSVGGWVPLKEETLARRRSGGGLILQDTGRLKGSFEQLELTNSYVVIGSRLVYAATHQYGRGVIPARPMLPSATQARELGVSMLRATIEKLKAQP